MNNLKLKISNFIELTRGYVLMITLASCLVIFSYAYYSELFNWFNFILLVLAISFIHLGANLYDDYVDVKDRLKYVSDLSQVSFEGFRPKARLILDGTYSLNQAKYITAILFLIPTLIGIYFISFSGFPVLFYMIAGVILTLFYPISSKYCLAEISIGLIYGPLVINGGYYALTKLFDPNLFLISMAVFFTCLVLLHTHSLMDYEFDEKAGKKTICILSKSKPFSINVLKLFIIIPYLFVVIGVLCSCLNPKTLYVFFTLPIATKLIESMKDYINIKDIQFIPRWYYGIFENWENIQKNHIEFFMFRFYLARNFAFFFALFLCIGTMS